jgi:hypothetical protein
MNAKLLTAEQREKMLANHRANSEREDDDGTKPVVKLFDPYGQATWLLSELDEDNIAFGLCDLGMGFPELGSVSLDEIGSMQAFGKPRIERDRHWQAERTLMEYADSARCAGRIVAEDRGDYVEKHGTGVVAGADNVVPIKTVNFTWHADPGHAWLEVPTILLIQLGVFEKITPYSYLGDYGQTAYLEEDCDAGTLIDAYKVACPDCKFVFTDKYLDASHWIRELPRFSAQNERRLGRLAGR